MDDRRRGRASGVATMETRPLRRYGRRSPRGMYRLNRTVRGHNRCGKPHTLLDRTAPLANPAGYVD